MKTNLKLFMACCLFITGHTIYADDHRPVINSNQILESEYLSSTYHRVENVEFVNGFYLFNVESDFGPVEIVSRALLKKRVDEIKTLGEAISLYERENRQLSNELRSELSVTGKSAMDIIANPFNTASQLANQLRDNLGDTLAGKNPFMEEYALRYSYSEPSDPTTAAHKRNTAYQMQLDLYSGNYRVQSLLNTIARARSAGRVSAGVGVGHGFFSTGRQSALDQNIRLTLKNKTLEQLNQLHRDLLNKMDTNLLQADAFMEQPFLSPTNRTVMLSYLNQVSSVNDLDRLIELIISTDNEVTTLVFERLCKALYFYFNRVEQFDRFMLFENLPAVTTASGVLVLFEHKDLLVWADENKSKYEQLVMQAKEQGYERVRLVSLGSLSDMAANKLAELGYQPRQNFLSALSD
ncbi:MAG: hypothetical protein RIB78_08745 [Gammaproteobacteria bacterium]